MIGLKNDEDVHIINLFDWLDWTWNAMLTVSYLYTNAYFHSVQHKREREQIAMAKAISLSCSVISRVRIDYFVEPSLTGRRSLSISCIIIYLLDTLCT